MNLFNKISFILSIHSKIKLQFISILFLVTFAGILEIIGLYFTAILFSNILDYKVVTNLGNAQEFNLLNLIINWFSSQALLSQALQLGALFSLKAFFNIFLNNIILRNVQEFQVVLRDKIFRSYLLMSYTKFRKLDVANVVQSIISLCAQFGEACLLNTLRAFGEFSISLAILIFLAFYNPEACFSIIVIFSSAMILYKIISSPFLKKAGFDANQSLERLIRFTKDAVNNYKQIKVLNSQEYFLKNANNSAKIYAKNFVLVHNFIMLPRFIFEILIFLVLAILILISDINTSEGKSMFFETAAVFGVAAFRILPAFNFITSAFTNFEFYKNTIDRIYETIISSEISEKNNIKENKKLKFNQIKLSEISFKFDSNDKDYVLKDLNFVLKEGDFIGIKGESGSGKTTFIDILLGLLEPSSGKFIIDKNIYLKLPMSFKNNFCYVPQNSVCISANIYENIAMYKVDNRNTRDEIKKIIKTVGLKYFIDQQNDGYNTILGDNAVQMSGGQKQKLSIARALFKKTPIIILDEVTASLDLNATEEILKIFKNISQNKTVIMISHDLSSFKYCKKVYHLKNKNFKKNNL